MSSKKRNALIMLIIVVVLAIAIIISLILLILQRTGLDTITISPDFSDMQLDINGDYKINVKTDPDGADISKFKYEIDSSSATFTVFDDGSAILHTSSEGAVTINVKKGKVESNSLTFEIVDKAAQEAARRAAEEALAAEAAAAEEIAAAEEAAAAEPAAANVTYVKVIKDTVNVRSSASTDSDVVGKASKGDKFEVIEDDGSWTKVKFGDKEGYIRNDLIEPAADGEPEEKPKEETKKEEKKEEKKQEAAADNTQQPANTDNNAQAANTDQASQANADAQAEALKKQEEEAIATLLAQQAAQATPIAWTHPDGTKFSAQEVQIFKNNWGDDWQELAPHHPGGELKTLVTNSGVDPAFIL